MVIISWKTFFKWNSDQSFTTQDTPNVSRWMGCLPDKFDFFNEKESQIPLWQNDACSHMEKLRDAQGTSSLEYRAGNAKTIKEYP